VGRDATYDWCRMPTDQDKGFFEKTI
jgi:hypothetical protein